MKLVVNGAETHVATGGKEFDASLSTVLFLHGSGMDHRSWALQTRWFAYNGFSVLAPDLPGHSLSKGDALNSLEAAGEWLIDLLSAAKVKSAHVVGHSQGFLGALELYKQAPKAVKSITGIGTAAAIPVNPQLIETAIKSAQKAADMMLQWGIGQTMHMGTSPIPGMQPIAAGHQIMSNNPLAVDLQSCADYQGGDAILPTITVPRMLVLAGQDKMTPLKAGQAAAATMNIEPRVLQDYGHMLPMEAPKEVLSLLKEFILTNAKVG